MTQRKEERETVESSTFSFGCFNKLIRGFHWSGSGYSHVINTCLRRKLIFCIIVIFKLVREESKARKVVEVAAAFHWKNLILPKDETYFIDFLPLYYIKLIDWYLSSENIKIQKSKLLVFIYCMNRNVWFAKNCCWVCCASLDLAGCCCGCADALCS